MMVVHDAVKRIGGFTPFFYAIRLERNKKNSGKTAITGNTELHSEKQPNNNKKTMNFQVATPPNKD
ncbi:MAG: hypothetical protein FJX94_07475 [Bacteroidetes bacterium]|nr:hypothetical protein [Bacteroidota bacterium]